MFVEEKEEKNILTVTKMELFDRTNEKLWYLLAGFSSIGL